jgi:hypothetical protein
LTYATSLKGPALRKLFEKYQPDAVMNLAAESHVDRSIDGPGDFNQTNIVDTFTLLQGALRYWRTLPPQGRAGRRTDANSRKPCPHCRVVRSTAAIPYRAAIGSKRRTRPPLADS